MKKFYIKHIEVDIKPLTGRTSFKHADTEYVYLPDSKTSKDKIRVKINKGLMWAEKKIEELGIN